MADVGGSGGAGEEPALQRLAERQTRILERIANLEESFSELWSSDLQSRATAQSKSANVQEAEGEDSLESPLKNASGDDIDNTNVGASASVQPDQKSLKPSDASLHSELHQGKEDGDFRQETRPAQLNASTTLETSCKTESPRPEKQNGVLGHSLNGATTSTQQRLEKLCRSLGCQSVKFKAVVEDYYDRSLEERRDMLGAASVHHLCKSIVMANTQAPSEITGGSNPKLSKYYVVVVQYSARLNTEKVKNFVYTLSEGKLPKKRINMRLAPSEVSDELTGYTHNSVTPFGMKTSIPVILSDAITKLEPPFFWLGAGDVNLKLGLEVSEFVDAVKPFVIDCT